MPRLLQIVLAFSVLLFTSPVFAQEKINIVATTSLIADLLKNITGEKAAVSSLMGAGVDPHLYKATQGDLRQLLSADLIFYNGLHLEGKMTDALASLAQRKKVYEISSTIKKEDLRFPKDFEGHPDPHIWFDVILWSNAIEASQKALSENYPEFSEYFKANAAAYRKKFEDLNGYVKSEIAKIPKTHRVLITAHDAFGYFGRAYDIEVMGLQGISTASEFGLADVTRLVDVIIERKIKAVFVESSVPQKYVLALQEGVKAKGFNVEIGGQLYSDSLGEAASGQADYLGMVKYNVDTIVKALK